MGWSVSLGSDSGDPVIVSTNEDFRDPKKRAGLTTRVSIRFLGNYMLQAEENRTAFEDALEPFLRTNGGYLVAGITRTQPVSYTYLVYCRSNSPDANGVPIPDFLRDKSLVSIHDDPEWAEYASWLPEQARGFGKIAAAFQTLAFLIRAGVKKLRKP